MLRRKGSAAIEFALLLPVMMSILMGIFEYGHYFSKKQELYNIVTETCGEEYIAQMDDVLLNYFSSCNPALCSSALTEDDEFYVCDITKQYTQVTGFFPLNMVPQKFELRAVKRKTEEQVNDTGG